MPSTPVGGDTTINEETENSTQSEQDLKNDGVILAQPVVEKPVTPLIPSTQAAQNPPFKDDENPSIQDVQNPIV